MAQRVAVVLGPAPPREVLADLLQGMDYVLVGSSNDPEAVRDIILRPSSSGPGGLPPTAAPGAAAEDETVSEETPGSASQSPSPPAVAGQARPAKTPEEQLEELRRLQEQQPNTPSR